VENGCYTFSQKQHFLLYPLFYLTSRLSLLGQETHKYIEVKDNKVGSLILMRNKHQDDKPHNHTADDSYYFVEVVMTEAVDPTDWQGVLMVALTFKASASKIRAWAKTFVFLPTQEYPVFGVKAAYPFFVVIKAILAVYRTIHHQCI
jgi:hypothetical protein